MMPECGAARANAAKGFVDRLNKDVGCEGSGIGDGGGACKKGEWVG